MKTISLQSSHLKIPETTLRAIKKAAEIFTSENLEDVLQDYPDPSGDDLLRERINAMTPTWSGEVLVTGSATQGLNLALNIIGRKKTLAVKTPVFFGVLRQAEELGIRIKIWEDVQELESLGSFDAVLLSSNFTPPEGNSFSAEEKVAIAKLAEKNDAFIIEDNAYDPIWYDSFPAPINYNPDKIIRVCSLSKIAAPSFRLGFVKAASSVIKAMRSAKITLDLSTSIIPQLLAREALAEDVLNSFRKEMRERVILLRDLLQQKTGINITMPHGGVFICLNLPEGTDIKGLQDQLIKLEVLVDTNYHYYPDGKNRPYIRLNAGAASQEQIKRAALRIAIVLSNMSPQQELSKAKPYAGKTILVTAGHAIESIDVVRHFTNKVRPESQGHQLAEELVELGAKVVLVSAKTKVQVNKNIVFVSETLEGKPIRKTEDLLSTATAISAAIKFDAVVSMVSVPSLKIAHEYDKKLKVKHNQDDLITLEVQKNISPVEYFKDNTDIVTVMGYDQYQKLVVLKDSELSKGIVSIIEDLKNKPKLEAPKEICTTSHGTTQLLKGKKIIVTSGRTHEKLNSYGDIITNFASGRQGHAIASSLANMGAEVVLITGPSIVADPENSLVRTLHIETADELHQTSLKELPADAAVCVCAVSDFKISNQEESDGKIVLVQNPDTLMSLGRHATLRPKVVIGFAAETNDLINYATDKLKKKGADAICANQVGKAMAERHHNLNSIQFITHEVVDSWYETTKEEIGLKIGEVINSLLKNKLA